MTPDTSMKRFFVKVPRLQGKRIFLREITDGDADFLHALAIQRNVYRYLPTFLLEQKYEDAHEVIRRLYDECLDSSLILGVFMDDNFCGLAEMYSYREPIHKNSVGYRLKDERWRKGIATETLGMMTDFLFEEKGIEIITASTMVENQASANVLKKNGFDIVVHAVGEDWGYSRPTIADKWVR